MPLAPGERVRPLSPQRLLSKYWRSLARVILSRSDSNGRSTTRKDAGPSKSNESVNERAMSTTESVNERAMSANESVTERAMSANESAMSAIESAIGKRLKNALSSDARIESQLIELLYNKRSNGYVIPSPYTAAGISHRLSLSRSLALSLVLSLSLSLSLPLSLSPPLSR